MLSGLSRGRIVGAAQADPDGRLRVAVTEHIDDVPANGRTRELEADYRAIVEEILELRGDDGRVAAFLRSVIEPGALADTAGYSDRKSTRLNSSHANISYAVFCL